MSQQNQIVNRLQQRKSQIVRMLSPGVSRSREKQGGWNFSPVAPSFGGRKFQLAAQKMRILDQGILGPSFSERALDMANAIQAKFEDPKSMLHIFAATGERSFWSEVEQVFPSQVSEQAETPSEPEELRRGSLIQRFETFPRPGQSLESFKEQVQDNQVIRKSDEISQLKKLSLPPKDRLSARVQELTGAPQKSVGPSNVGKPVERSLTPGKTIQRRPEQAVPSEQTAAQTLEASESSKPELALARPTQEHKVDRSNLPIALPVKRPAKPASSKILLPKATPNTPSPQAQSGLQPEQPTRRPVSSVKRIIQRQMESGRLAQKVETQPGIQPSETMPESAAKTSIPQEHLPAQPEHAKSPPEIRPGMQPPVNTSEPAAITSPQQEHLPSKSEHPQSPPEMPLTQHLQRRSAAIEGLHPGVTGHVLPITSPKIPGSTIRPVQRKALVSNEGPKLAAPSPAGPSLLQLKPSQFTLHHPADAWKAARASFHSAKTAVSNAIDTVTAPIKTVQSTINETVNKAVSTVTAPIKAPETTIQASFDKAIDTVAAPTKTVQPKRAEMPGDEEESSGPTAQKNIQKPEKTQSSPDQLAEQILPLVKRLLEIESERTGRQFH